MNSIVESIPTRWKNTKIKYSCYLKARVGWKGMTSDEFRDESYSYLITGTDFKSRSINLKKCYQVDEFRYADDPYIQLREGDLLITKDGTIGKLSFVPALDKPACLNSGIFLLRTDDTVFNQFLYWVLSSKIFHDFMDLETTGSTIKHLYQESFGNFKYPLPSVYEQRQITAYLNRETAKIDNLISKQKKLIALLKEKRQAVISQAVTKGLDPNVEMKDSGVDWLGDVPQHWSVKKLKYVCRVTTGNKDTQDAVDDGLYPFFVRSQTVERIDSYSFDGEGVLTAGDGAGVGKVFHYHKGKLAFHQRVYLLYGFNDYSAKLMFHHLKEHFYNVALGGQAKSTVDSLRMPIFLNFEVPVPTENEQIEILKTVEQIDQGYQKIIEKSEQSIALLQERRQALITAAVTGNIDVRDLVSEEEVASLEAEIEQDDFDVDSEVEDLDEPEMASEEE